MKYTIADFKKEIVNFYDSFEIFMPLNFHNYVEGNVSITNSAEVLLKKFCLYPDFDMNEIEGIPSNSYEQLSQYSHYFHLLDYIGHMDGGITSKYRDLYRADKYDESFKPATGSNISKLDVEFRREYLSFKPENSLIREIANSYLYNLIKLYFFIKPFKKSSSIERLIEILQSGGLPCGFYYLDENEDYLDREVNFLVYYSKKEGE